MRARPTLSVSREGSPRSHARAPRERRGAATTRTRLLSRRMRPRTKRPRDASRVDRLDPSPRVHTLRPGAARSSARRPGVACAVRLPPPAHARATAVVRAHPVRLGEQGQRQVVGDPHARFASGVPPHEGREQPTVPGGTAARTPRPSLLQRRGGRGDRAFGGRRGGQSEVLVRVRRSSVGAGSRNGRRRGRGAGGVRGVLCVGEKRECLLQQRAVRGARRRRRRRRPAVCARLFVLFVSSLEKKTRVTAWCARPRAHPPSPSTAPGARRARPRPRPTSRGPRLRACA